MARKKFQPFARCTQCGETTTSANAINRRHIESSGAKPCTGTFRSAIGENDWAECTACGTTGRVGDKTCDSCNGEGWLYARMD